MGKLYDLFNETVDYCEKNSPAILSTFACLGVVGTMILGVHAGKKVAKKEDKVKEQIKEKEAKGEVVTKKESRIMYVKSHFPEVIPVIVVGTLSITCTIASYKISAKRIAALSTAYALLSKTHEEYKKAAQKLLGEKEKEIERERMKTQMEKNPPPDELKEETLKKVGEGGKTTNDIYQTVPVWYDELSNQYFKATEAEIREAFANVRTKLRGGTYDFVSVNDFLYDIPDAKHNIPTLDRIGWTAARFPNGPRFNLDDGAKAPNGLFVGKIEYDWGTEIDGKDWNSSSAYAGGYNPYDKDALNFR